MLNYIVNLLSGFNSWTAFVTDFVVQRWKSAHSANWRSEMDFLGFQC